MASELGGIEVEREDNRNDEFLSYGGANVVVGCFAIGLTLQ
jgi:hypothetical protein